MNRDELHTVQAHSKQRYLESPESASITLSLKERSTSIFVARLGSITALWSASRTRRSAHRS